MKHTLKNRPRPAYGQIHNDKEISEWFEGFEQELREEKARLERYGFTDRDDYILIKKLLGEEAS